MALASPETDGDSHDVIHQQTTTVVSHPNRPAISGLNTRRHTDAIIVAVALKQTAVNISGRDITTVTSLKERQQIKTSAFSTDKYNHG